MKIDELIKTLLEAKELFGDIDVVLPDSSFCSLVEFTKVSDVIIDKDKVTLI